MPAHTIQCYCPPEDRPQFDEDTKKICSSQAKAIREAVAFYVFCQEIVKDNDADMASKIKERLKHGGNNENKIS